MTLQLSPLADRLAALIGNIALLIAVPAGALAFILQSV